MELGSYSEDRLDQIIAGGELEIGRIRLLQMAAISEKRRRKSHVQDGYRSMVDWTAARADVSHEIARSLCWTASRLADAPKVAEQLAAGEISFDRAAQLARLPETHRKDHQGYDIAQLRRLVADHKRVTRKRERKTGSGYLHFGQSDELATSIWGELPGLDSRIVEKAVDQRADEIIPTDQKLAVAERRALALVAICQDTLYQTGQDSESTATELTVMVDTRMLREANGETGARVLGGPRIGPGALEELFCQGRIDLVGIIENGKPLDLGRRCRTVGRKLRRHVLHRDGGCTVEGCTSRYRLEVHMSNRGPTEATPISTI